MTNHRTTARVLRLLLIAGVVGASSASIGWAADPSMPPVSAPDTQKPEGPPADVQERAVPRMGTILDMTGTSKAGGKGAAPSTPAPSSGPGGPLPVVGGISEPDFQYPWVVRMNGCAGVLIDPQWVLTAAHCVTPNIGFGKLTYNRTDPYTGAVQTETIGPMSEQRPNPGVYIHPNYAPSMDQANDIALIKLAKPFAINPYLQTVGLPKDFRHSSVVGTLASIDHLRPLPPGKAAIFRAPIPADTFPPKFNITASAALASLCPGDSGSGFVTVENGRATVRGIASQGTITDCMTPSGEAVFTDVFAFRGWILQTMGKGDTLNTRVRWGGRTARGVMGLGCLPNPTIWGPLNVIGVEEGNMCDAGQTQTVMCNLDKNQGNVGMLMPVLSGLTVRTTVNGAAQVQTIPASGNTASFFGVLPAGASREFTCQIGNGLISGTIGNLGGNMAVMSRGIEEGQPTEPTVEQPSPFDPVEEAKP